MQRQDKPGLALLLPLFLEQLSRQLPPQSVGCAQSHLARSEQLPIRRFVRDGDGGIVIVGEFDRRSKSSVL